MADHGGIPIGYQPPEDLEKKKSIFINGNREQGLIKSSTVHFNPHFKENKKVFVNPNFQLQIQNNELLSRPRIHVNPNVLKPVAPVVKSVVKNPAFPENPKVAYTFPSGNKPVVGNSNFVQVKKPTVPAIQNNIFRNQKPNLFCKINYNGSGNSAVYTAPKISCGPQYIQANLELCRRTSQLPTNANVNSVNSYKLNQNAMVNNAMQRKNVHTISQLSTSATVNSQKLNQNFMVNNTIQRNKVHTTSQLTTSTNVNSHKLNQNVTVNNAIQMKKVHTRLRIVNETHNKKLETKPDNTQKQPLEGKDNSVCTRFKYIRNAVTTSTSDTLGPLRVDHVRDRKPDFLENPKTNFPKNNSAKTKGGIVRFNHIRKGTKLVKINNAPITSKYKIVNNSAKTDVVLTKFKYIRKGIKLVKIHNTPITSKYKIVKNSAKINGVDTKFKHIRNRTKLMKINKAPVKSKYKIVNNVTPQTPGGTINRADTSSNSNRKKYIFLNKYNSSSFLANNVILKNSNLHNSMKINGILYKNPPCLLKKSYLKSNFAGPISCSNRKRSTKQITQTRGKYRIVRSNSSSKLRKSNIACPIYRKTGKCSGQKKGTCIKVHDPEMILLCKSFLRGECHNDTCLLSHKVSSEKMPTCKYFLEGLCNKAECQYLHVKISPTAEICRQFLEGYCKEGIKCDKRHQFLCPDYEKNEQCSKSKCAYPHGSLEVVKSKTTRKANRRTLRRKETKSVVDKVEDNCAIRYYEDNEEKTRGIKRPNEDTADDMSLPKREKLGLLPSFIPIS